jgi:hypothetical protein
VWHSAAASRSSNIAHHLGHGCRPLLSSGVKGESWSGGSSAGSQPGRRFANSLSPEPCDCSKILGFIVSWWVSGGDQSCVWREQGSCAAARGGGEEAGVKKRCAYSCVLLCRGAQWVAGVGCHTGAPGSTQGSARGESTRPAKGSRSTHLLAEVQREAAAACT